MIRAKITRYLSISRDYFLVPIYDKENLNFTNARSLVEIMVTYGIPIRTTYGIEIRTRETQDRTIRVPNVKGFLADTEAYVGVLSILESRDSFQHYRTSIVAEAAILRKSLEESVYAD